MYRAKTYGIQISILCILMCLAMVIIYMNLYVPFTQESIITQRASIISEELKAVPACKGKNNSFVALKVRIFIGKQIQVGVPHS